MLNKSKRLAIYSSCHTNLQGVFSLPVFPLGLFPRSFQVLLVRKCIQKVIRMVCLSLPLCLFSFMENKVITLCQMNFRGLKMIIKIHSNLSQVRLMMNATKRGNPSCSLSQQLFQEWALGCILCFIYWLWYLNFKSIESDSEDDFILSRPAITHGGTEYLTNTDIQTQGCFALLLLTHSMTIASIDLKKKASFISHHTKLRK